MHTNELAIQEFYTAFAKKDAEKMARLYSENAQFSDPVFPKLQGQEVTMMWAMLCERAVDFELSFSAIQADDHRGEAHWQAHYTFSKTGRKVVNRVKASFEFENGKVIKHRDDFNFWAWSRMALGAPGIFMGWSRFLKTKVQKEAATGLKRFSKMQKTVLSY